ncbi:MAG: mechanosensitive ion channel family protein [Chloroflexi bacterium]|nr:mechanosensitive ion channel family protein [Chloroflexota bacterium]MBP8057726.1 mechanosensitive ion channel family protein [Chloroflexota bacterium]
MITWFTSLPTFWQNFISIFIGYMVSWIIHRLSGRITLRLMNLNRLSREPTRLRPERIHTLQGLVAGSISFLAFLIATIFAFSLFVNTDTLIWMVGLFSAAFGLGARPLVSDYLSGMNLLFEDPFDVGEKIELHGLTGGQIEGVVEQVNLRSTQLRAPTGELFSIPNGEIRVVRNFSRGRFSMADIAIKINSDDLSQVLPLLETMGKEAMELLPNLLEPWQVISQTGLIGQHTELTLVAKARFGKAAEMRPRLLALVQEKLSEAGIELAE